MNSCDLALVIVVFDLVIDWVFLHWVIILFVTSIVTYFRGMYLISILFGFYPIIHILFDLLAFMW